MIIYIGKHDHALIDVAILYFTAVFRRQLSRNGKSQRSLALPKF